MVRALVGLICASLWIAAACADQPIVDEEVIVTERSDRMIGVADNATEGVVGKQQLEYRPLSRVGEALETVPGLILTQHSGSGKANQYFLRGFNLDHGTDFASFVDGMPVNMPTHAHGQGYSDLNFLIPELISGIRYRKGPYYADEGDFSSAGAAHIEYRDKFDRNVAEITVGHYDYYRGLLGGSTALGNGNLLAAGEFELSNGPWSSPEDTNKYSGVVRYTAGDARNGWHVTGMAYSNAWNSTDQIPERAVTSGIISRFGALDPSDGGRTHRYSLSAGWQQRSDTAETHASAYFIDYALNLFSNFTFFLDDLVHGDQFEQQDRRRIYGGEIHQHWFGHLWGHDTEQTVGLQLRYDDIGSVALFHNEARARIGVTREDAVQQLSVSPYLENRTQWLPKFRTVAGIRGDFYNFDVAANNPLNSGVTSDGLASPKLSLIFGPWYDTEYYLSVGYGFHSNDARGTSITVDPTTGAPVDRVNPLVRAKGAEVGIRNASIPGLQTTLSGFLLDIDSELLFTGDAGTTEASRPSRRYGVEWTNYYTPLPWLTFDADFSLSTSDFKDDDPVGNHIPGAIEQVIAAGATVRDLKGFFGGIRLRYFGERPLIEDNSQRSRPTVLVNAEAGYDFDKHYRITLTALNLFDSKDHDIDYFYPSRLRGEPADGVNDIHFHPVEPAQLRLTLRVQI